jgi:hypothetical protein
MGPRTATDDATVPQVPHSLSGNGPPPPGTGAPGPVPAADALPAPPATARTVPAGGPWTFSQEQAALARVVLPGLTGPCLVPHYALNLLSLGRPLVSVAR